MTTNDDKELLQSIEQGEWKTVANFEEIKKNLITTAAETARKGRYHINVRISKRDVEALETKAFEDRIPYQALVASILHIICHRQVKEVHPKETKKDFTRLIYEGRVFSI